MNYLDENFLLTNEYSKKLFFNYAEKQPIFDYHCHLSEKEILENKEFEDLFELWLLHDHYKWRLMRQYGVDEEYITGDKPNHDKFVKFCQILGTAFSNPIYHWCQLELRQYFGINLEINDKNAEEIWEKANKYIKENKLNPQKLIEGSNVKTLFTTNEIFDDLSTFEEIAKKDYKFDVFPAFRADKLLAIDASNFAENLAKLGKINNLDELENVVESKLVEFIAHGTKACDIAVTKVCKIVSKETANAIFVKRLNNKTLSQDEIDLFVGYMVYSLFRIYAKHNLVVEFHIGATRNNNSLMFEKLGADSGFDAISDENCLINIQKLLDKLNSEHLLPKTILFNLNPKMNYELMVLSGCFQNESAKGKIQIGAAWWFLDNKVAIRRFLKDLGATTHIATFIGMLTDSRSFLSYARHGYFRRILCEYLGKLMNDGEITKDIELVGKVVEDICYVNAKNYMGI